nr:uncharacterized protein K02A2.6-like [Rhipicephalus microplus]
MKVFCKALVFLFRRMQQSGDEDGIGQELKTAMALSKLPEFAPGSGSFDVFVERFELYTTVNEIAEAKKQHLFLSAIGEEAYVTLRSLLLPKTPSTSSYPEVVSALKKHYSPRRSVARSVPYALREEVEQELANLEKAGVIYRVRHSAWATPLVIVPKKNGLELRLCGDYRVTVNLAIEVDQYLLPLTENIFATLHGGTVFSVLDLSKAYLQLELDERAQELLTVNTHLGLFRFRRLPYGVACAPAVFQAVMDQILHGLSGTTCYLDDVVIAGADRKQCHDRLEQVLIRLREHGIRVNTEKCKLFQERIRYLGHEVDQNGLHPTADKVAAIKQAPKPDNVTQFKAFLGLHGFYLPHKILDISHLVRIFPSFILRNC